MLAIHVKPDLAANVHAALAHDGITLQKKGEELFEEYAKDCLHRAGNHPPAAPPVAPKAKSAIPPAAPKFDVCTEQPGAPEDSLSRKFTHKGFDL